MIQAIETRYAGCRFRSRLEARWAVWLDHLGVAWEYEAQGYKCTYRLNCSDEQFYYLPDFWLPELGLHGEVKGSLTDSEASRLLHAAACLSANGGGGCRDLGGSDLVVFGRIPHPDSDFVPTRLHMHKGTLMAAPWDLTADDCTGSASRYAIYEAGNDGDGPGDVSEALLSGGYGSACRRFQRQGMVRDIGRAHAAARSARFEHGERGA